MNIFLIGMPGSGKSSVGKALADKLNFQFIDTDKEIEKKHEMSISKIFKIKGEDYFRAEEFDFLNQWQGDRVVMATGGGMASSEKNIGIMKNKGYIIYLDCPVDVVLARLQPQDINKRPKLSSTTKNPIRQTLAELLKNRIHYYKQADFTVNSQQSISNIVDLIEHHLSL